MEFLFIATAHFLALISPGPDFFLILQAALRLPKKFGIALSAGIAAANGVYLMVAVFSLETIRHFGWLNSLLRYFGAAYLIFLGICLLRSAGKINQSTASNDSILFGKRLSSQFLLGFTSAILNPKNGIFYLSLFTVMVAKTTPLQVRIYYAIWMTLVVFSWDCLLCWLIGNHRPLWIAGKHLQYLEKFIGVALVGFGVFLPFTV